MAMEPIYPVIVFLPFLVTLPCSCGRVNQTSLRGKVGYPKTIQLQDPKDPSKIITVYMDTSYSRSSYEPDNTASYYISKIGQSSPVKIDLDSIKPDHDGIKKDASWYFGIHGWTGNYNCTPITPELVKEIHKFENSNIIFVDWEKGASNVYYPTAALSAKLVGSVIADVINNLVKRGVAKKDKIYLIGFSLGGHVVGFIGKNLYSKYKWKPKKITSIDPAGPLYDDKPPEDRIDSTDAEYVEVFHASGDKLGFWKPIGHVDIYINKGTTRQPGCGMFEDISGSAINTTIFMEIWNGSCSHAFGKTVYGNYTHLRMQAYKCISFENFTKGHCGADVKVWCEVGFKYPQCKQGVYHLNTGSYFE